MKIQSSQSFWRLAPMTGLAALLACACTVEHMEVGVDQGGIGGQDPDPDPGDDSVCPEDCAVEDICHVCNDEEGTCATPKVHCNDDGSCGDVDWVCSSDPSTPTGPMPTGPACPTNVCDAICKGDMIDVPEGCPTPVCDCGDPSTGNCECAVPTICQLCPDGTCAVPNVECKPDGECGELTFSCSTMPNECPDPAVMCEAQCNGKVLDVPPDCPVSDCDCGGGMNCDCPIPEICKLCDDGTCAQGSAPCDANGECGDVVWTCEDEPEPMPTCACAVDAVCQLCDDGSCAKAEVACNPDGTCGETTFTCPPEPEVYDCDTSGVLCDLAIDCGEDEVPTRHGDCYGPCVKPEQCGEAKPYDCDTSGVLCKVAVDCAEGLVPTQEGDCYGPCVKPEQCAAPEERGCPEACAVPLICQECDDGSCAAADISCNEDGSCGSIEWVCPK